MKKIKHLFFLSLILFVSNVFAQVQLVTENEAGISKRLQHEIDMTKDPILGYVPKGRLIDAYRIRKDIVDVVNAANSRTGFTWNERGPYSDAVGPSNGNTRPGNGKTSGRVRAMWEDLSDATGNTVWVGGIDGGLWKTTNISSNPATWTAINDFFGNLAVGSICQDPTDYNIMYFGTGEKAINADAVRGAGIWRSTDHGVTWSVMSGSAGFWNVSKVICDASGNLYVACNSISNTAGLQRFTKSTGIWTNITPSGLDPRVPDIELSSTGRLHIVCGYYNTSASASGYRYTDNPSGVTSSGWSSPSTTFTTQYNVDLASNGNTLYALPSNSAWEVPTIYKSTNGGVNWSAITTPAFTSGQSWYNMAVAVDPNNANNVIVGALDCYKTTNGGTSWTKISSWYGTTGQYVHADQQAMIWRSNNRVLVASDGGIHLSTDGGATFTDRNVGLRIKQFYAIASHPTSANYFLAGAQDNGVHQLNGEGLTSSVEVTGGDGAYVHIDQNQGQYQWGSYVYNQYRRSTDNGASWSSINYSSSAGRFINPTDYDDVNNIMYCSGNANQYVRWSNPQSGSTFTAVTMSGLNNGKVSAVKVSPYTSNTVFFAGGGNGITPSLIKAVNANGTPTFTNIIGSGMTTASANISCIEVGSSDQNLIVVFSNYGVSNVWVSSDGGASWTDVDGSLPDMPVRWAMFYPGDNSKAIIATETGVWQTALLIGTSTVWEPESTFPNVRTDMLQYRASDALISAATHGRGIFTATLSTGPTCGTVAGLNASSIGDNAATLGWTSLAEALSYDVDYKLNTSSTWINAATATTELSVALSGLTQGTLYDYRVRANCDGATGSYAQAQFTTTAPFVCNAPAGLAAGSITSSSANVSWLAVSGAVSYDVDYKLSSNGTWTNSITGTTSTSRTISGLTESSVYDWRVKTNCSTSGSGYAEAQFTTTAATTCPGIYDVSTNGSYSGAALIPFNTDIYGLINVSGDNDYYKFVITTGGTATITLTTLPANYQLYLYSGNGTTLLASSTKNGTSSEIISRTYTAGTYYVRVNGRNSGTYNATSCYTLKVALGTATTQELPEGTLPEVTQEEAQPEFTVMLFPNPVKEILTIYFVGDNSVKNLALYDISGRMVYTVQLTDMFTSLDLHSLTHGLYIVQITQTDGKIVHSEKIVKE